MARRIDGRVRAILLTLAFASVFGGLATTRPFRALEQQLSRTSLPTDHRTRNRFRSLLRRSGSLEMQPPTSVVRRAPVDADGRCPDPELGTAAVSRAAMPSSRLAPPEFFVPGQSGISLFLEPCRFERLEQNRVNRGRDWEEPGWISVYEDGRLRFASAVGIRIHGRTRRQWSVPSYRLYFRSALGAREFPAELLGDGSAVSPRRLALKWDPGADLDGLPWPFVNTMAHDIGRRFGAVVPASRPVRVSLNGAEPRLYTMEERIDAQYFENNFEHTDFDFVRPKRDVGDGGAEYLHAETDWVQSRPRPLSAAVAESRFDLDRLAASLLTHAFCSTNDSFQETMFRDRRGVVAGGRWSWVLWDLDQSFHDYPNETTIRARTHLLPKMLRDARRARFLPEILAGRLLREDPVWRGELVERLAEALNFSLTPAFFSGMLDRYRQLASELAIDDLRFLDRMESYFEDKPQDLRAQLTDAFGTGEWIALDVGAGEHEIEVDGHLISGSRTLHYPVGRRLRLEVPARDAGRFLGWRIDGGEDVLRQPGQELELSRSLRIEPVFDEPTSLPVAMRGRRDP